MQPQKDELRGFSSFIAVAPTLAAACERHNQVKQATESISRAGHDLKGLWLELTGQFPKDEEPSELVNAARWSAPTDLLVVMHGCGDDIVAAFAFVITCALLPGYQPTDATGLRAMMEHVWRQVAERVKQALAIQEGFGRNFAPAWRTARKVERAGGPELLKRLTVIAQLAGRMHDSMKVVTRPVPNLHPQSVTGVEQGGQIERLMPAEMAKLTVPGGMSEIQSIKVLRKEADQREMKGEEPKGRGPLVIVRDESGSMHDEPGVPGRNSWAAASALALTRLAHGENRAVCVVHFSQVCVAQDIPKDDGVALEDMVLSFLNGGTDFVRPLAVARAEVARLDRAGFPGADIVYITDGEEGFDYGTRAQLDLHLDQMDRDGVRLWTVGIGKNMQESFPLRKRAERYVYAHDDSLKSRQRAVALATELTAAAVVDAKRWN